MNREIANDTTAVARQLAAKSNKEAGFLCRPRGSMSFRRYVVVSLKER
jgi:hypothetical protein